MYSTHAELYGFCFDGDDIDPLIEQMYSNLVAGVAPSVESRKAASPPQLAELKYKTVAGCEYVYPPIEQQLLDDCHCVAAWVGPTPKPVEDFMGVVTRCWRTVRSLGYFPGNGCPGGMTDKQIRKVMLELDHVMYTEWLPWGPTSGYKECPQFGDLDIQSMRGVVAELQSALHKFKVKESFK